MNGQCGLRVQFYTPKPPLPPPPREPRREPTAPARTASWVGSGGPGRPGGTGGFAAAMTAGGIRGGARHDEARTTRFEEPQSRGERGGRGDGRSRSEYQSDGRGGDLGGQRVGSGGVTTGRGSSGGGGGPGSAAVGGYRAERMFSNERGGGVSGAGRSDQGRSTTSHDTAYRELYAALRASDHAQRTHNAHAHAHAHAHVNKHGPRLLCCQHALTPSPGAAPQEPAARRDGRPLPAEQQWLRLRRRILSPLRQRRRRRALHLPWCSGAWPPVVLSAGGRRVLQTCEALGTAERWHGRLWVGWWAAHASGGSQGGGGGPDASNPASPANPAVPASPAFRLERAGEGGPGPAGKQIHAAPSRAAEVPTAARRAAHRAAPRPHRRRGRRSAITRRCRAATARRRRAATAPRRRAATARCRGIVGVQLLRAEVPRWVG